MSKHKTKSFSDLDYWLSEWLKSDRRGSANTAASYRLDLRQFFDSVKKRFDQVTVGDVLEYQSSLPDKYTAKTKARKVATVRSFYKFLNNREVTNLNLTRIESPKIQQRVEKDKLLTEKEVQAIIDAATNDQHRIFVKFLYLTAVRVSEALALRWRDVVPFEDGSAEAHISAKARSIEMCFCQKDCITKCSDPTAAMI